MNNELTDRSFWSNYWESKTGLAVSVNKDFLFHELLENIIKRGRIENAIELGGFPGYYAVFLKKHFGIKSTLLDYFIHEGIMEDVLHANGLQRQDINVIEADLFNYQPNEQYNLVLSCGLIEHFQDTKDIIQRHLSFLAPGGTLFITLPNFTGVNGWVQKNFDRENYRKHNINCMEPQFLKSIATDLGLKNIKTGYYGGFGVWLENKKEKSLLVKAFIKAIWFAGKIPAKIFGFESRFLSPYIILQAEK